MHGSELQATNKEREQENRSPLCGGTLRVIAGVTDPDTIQTVLIRYSDFR
jgi:hypothetical protein|tara:strand:+ start:720 stop:869 length:150 start_codon:yes stop_codon:yes gene_type:complete